MSDVILHACELRREQIKTYNLHINLKAKQASLELQ